MKNKNLKVVRSNLINMLTLIVSSVFYVLSLVLILKFLWFLGYLVDETVGFFWSNRYLTLAVIVTFGITLSRFIKILGLGKDK